MTLYGNSPDPDSVDFASPATPRQRVGAPDEPLAGPEAEEAAGAEAAALRAESVAADPIVAEPEPIQVSPAFPPSFVEPTPAAATGFSAPDLSAPDLAALDLDEPAVPPWDRRPLMVVIAAAAVLVVLAVVSGVASAALFRPAGSKPSWLVANPPTGPAPTTSPGVVPAPVDGSTVTLAGVGDVILGTQNRPGGLPPNDGAGFFDPVKDALAADVVMGNLESPLTVNTGTVKCPADTAASNCFQFYVPPSYANHLRDGGFHVMNLANNHAHDMGVTGYRNTQEALEGVGLKYTGGKGQITTVDVKGVKVAVVGFSGSPCCQNINDIPAAEQLVRKAAGEADLVVVQMQGGSEGGDKSHTPDGAEEYGGQRRGELRKFSRAVIDAGADVVMGHGPHIMRGMEFYKGRLIAYSLGNFCGYKTLNSDGFNGVGGVLKVTLNKDGSWVRGQLVATEMVNGGLPAVDAEKRALSFVHGLSQQDFGAAAAQISSSDGTITQPAL